MDLETLLLKFSMPEAKRFLAQIHAREQDALTRYGMPLLDDRVVERITSTLHNTADSSYMTKKAEETRELVSLIVDDYLRLPEAWGQKPTPTERFSSFFSQVSSNVPGLLENLTYKGVQEWISVGFGRKKLPTSFGTINPITYFTNLSQGSMSYKVYNFIYQREKAAMNARDPSGTNVFAGVQPPERLVPPPLPPEAVPTEEAVDSNPEILVSSTSNTPSTKEDIENVLKGIEKLNERLQTLGKAGRQYAGVIQQYQLLLEKKSDDIGKAISDISRQAQEAQRKGIEEIINGLKDLRAKIEANNIGAVRTDIENLGKRIEDYVQGQAANTPGTAGGNPTPPVGSATAIGPAIPPPPNGKGKWKKVAAYAAAIAGILGAGIFGGLYYDAQRKGYSLSEEYQHSTQTIASQKNLMNLAGNKLKAAREICGTHIQENIGKPKGLVELIEDCYLTRQPYGRVILEGKSCEAMYKGLHYALGGTAATEKGFVETLKKVDYCNKSTVHRPINYPIGSIPVIVVTKEHD